MENKKVRGTKEVVVNGIKFKSTIEGRVYAWLLEEGIKPKYEAKTYELSTSIRPTIPFFNRVGRLFGLDMRPVQAITYTPDFTFGFNGILIIIEVKGIENDVFPYKRNLFRKYLEDTETPVMFFEIRTKKELKEALRIIRAEDSQVQQVRKLITSLPDKDISKAHKLLEGRNWAELHKITSLAIKRVEKANANGEPMYNNINLESLRELLRLT